MANLNFNKVIIGGRLTADPELKTTQSGKGWCSFSVAVNRKSKDQATDFFNVIAWDKTAEVITKYFHKGSCIMITGKLQTRKWQDQSGNQRFSTDIVAENVDFVDSRAESGIADPPTYSSPADVPKAAPAPQAPTQEQLAPNFEPLGDDEELPF